jgi:hypothetical protein
MNTMQKIAVAIYQTAIHQGWKAGTKDADKRNLEAWRGAALALEAVDHTDKAHVLNVFALLICTRGFSETRKIAIEAMGDDVAAEYVRRYGVPA